MTGNPKQAAKHFKRDPATVRKWIAEGCPVLRPGGKGPGKAAVLEFAAVKTWLGRHGGNRKPGHAGQSVEGTLAKVAEALADCLAHDRVEERTGATAPEAAGLFLLYFDRLSKLMGKKYTLDTLPEGIRALMRVLSP